MVFVLPPPWATQFVVGVKDILSKCDHVTGSTSRFGGSEDVSCHDIGLMCDLGSASVPSDGLTPRFGVLEYVSSPLYAADFDRPLAVNKWSLRQPEPNSYL